MVTTEGRIILTHEEIEKKIYRLAFQLYEYFLEEKEVIIAGITGNGMSLAKEISQKVEEISGINTTIVEILLDKQHLNHKTTSYSPEADVKDKAVIIVDDVLNTGKTMVYAVSAFIREGSKVIKTVVLADRNHRKFPVSADYVGISLATTLQEHLDFKIEDGKMNLYLR